jgi:hypothetical protein
MRNTFLFSIFILLLTSCGKDKFNTTPSLKYKSVNKTTFGRFDGELVFTLSFTDAEGDLDGMLTVVKQVQPCIDGTDYSFTAPYSVPEFPSGKNQKGDFLVTFGYNDITPRCSNRNDTAIFKFVLQDKALHVSDTAVSEPIILIKN